MSCKYRYLTKKFFQVHVIQIPFSIAYINNSLVLRLFSYMLFSLTFLQEKNTRRIFYGLDDIERASEIIIVCLPLSPLNDHMIDILNCEDQYFNSLGKIKP